MQTPCSAFVTFESEEGYNRAVMYNQMISELEEFSHFKTFLYQEIEVKPASEPSDILWENRYLTPFSRFWRKVLVYFIIICMLFVSFQFIYNFQMISIAKKGRYPP